MSYHVWGSWPDELFADVENAASEIGQFCRKWGRINVTQTKEKYGTARVYCNFGAHQLHTLIYPGYVYNQFPTWLWTLDCNYISRFFDLIRFNKIVLPYQKFIYNLAYQRALKKYPQIKEEILHGADWLEYIKGTEELQKEWTTTTTDIDDYRTD